MTEDQKNAINSAIDSVEAAEKEGMLISVRECAKLLKIGKSTIYRYIEIGYITAETGNGKTRIRATDKNLSAAALAAKKKINEKKRKSAKKYSYKVSLEIPPSSTTVECLNTIHKLLQTKFEDENIEKICAKVAENKKTQSTAVVIPVKIDKETYNNIRNLAKKYSLTVKETLLGMAQHSMAQQQ